MFTQEINCKDEGLFSPSGLFSWIFISAKTPKSPEWASRYTRFSRAWEKPSISPFMSGKQIRIQVGIRSTEFSRVVSSQPVFVWPKVLFFCLLALVRTQLISADQNYRPTITKTIQIVTAIQSGSHSGACEISLLISVDQNFRPIITRAFFKSSETRHFDLS